MSEESAGKPEPGFSEAEVRQVLEQAARIESGQGGLSATELQSVAEEAGFSREAVSRAMDDILSARSLTAPRDRAPAPAPTPPPARGILAKTSKWMRTLVSAAAGGAAGFLSFAGMAAGGPGPELLAVVVLGAALLSRAFHHRREGDADSYQHEAAGVWAGFGTSFLAGTRFMETIFPFEVFMTRGIVFIAVMWLLSAVIGGLIVQTARDTSGDEPIPRPGR
jgi:hypothetical protein